MSSGEFALLHALELLVTSEEKREVSGGARSHPLPSPCLGLRFLYLLTSMMGLLPSSQEKFCSREQSFAIIVLAVSPVANHPHL